MKKLMATIMLAMLAASLGWAQGDEPADAPPPPDPPAAAAPMPGQIRTGPGMPMGDERITFRAPRMTLMRGPGEGKWWKNPELAQKLGLTDDQISKMEKIFQDHRLQLIDLHAALEKQEVLLEPMINAEHPDEQQTLERIDKVAQARADLEKSNARMLFAIRNVLTPEQWKQLQSERESRRVRRDQRFRTRRPGRPGAMGQPMPSKPPGAPAPAPVPAPQAAPANPQNQ
jgi:Spy/CpxP family protein refolding chaperone